MYAHSLVNALTSVDNRARCGPQTRTTCSEDGSCGQRLETIFAMLAAEHEFGDDTVAGATAIRCEHHRHARLIRFRIAASGSNYSQSDVGRPHCRTIRFVRNASLR